MLGEGISLIVALLALSFFCNLIINATVGVSLKGWKDILAYREVFWQGWLETILLSLIALCGSTLFAVIIAFLRRSQIKTIRAVAWLFIEVIRGTPLLVQVLFFFYVISPAIGLENRLLIGVIILSLFNSVIIAEMMRASIGVIPGSQIESAKAIGLSSWQTYYYIIAPQAVRHLLPSLTGQFASIIKDSSLLSIIGLSEFTLAAEQVNAVTYLTLESFFPLAIGYLFLTLPISLGSRWLEKRLSSH
jgi:polar amino acid transport system permease protein